MIALILFWSFFSVAAAEVSLVQVVQSQTSQGSDGLFGKTWVTASGRRMRIVSGFARKVPGSDHKSFEEPARLVQILNLDTTSLLRIDPAAKTFEERPFSDVRYADSMHRRLSRGAAEFSIVGSTVSVKPGELKREYMGAVCGHYQISVLMTLAGPGGKPATARMTQDVWVAPVLGSIQKGLLDLISFEASYRKVTGASLTPLDYETYQIREAAAYLRVPDNDLMGLVGRVKEVFIEVPGYPLTSSVSWWREPENNPEEAAPPKTDRKKPQRRAESRQPRRSVFRRLTRVEPLSSGEFRPVQWHRTWNEIDEMIARTGQTFGVFTLGPLRNRGRSRPLRYGDFQRGLEEIVAVLDRVEESRPPEPPQRRRRQGQSPFYEIFSEMNQLEFLEALPDGHFNPPEGYARKQ